MLKRKFRMYRTHDKRYYWITRINGLIETVVFRSENKSKAKNYLRKVTGRREVFGNKLAAKVHHSMSVCPAMYKMVNLENGV